MLGRACIPERPWFSYIAPQVEENASVMLGDWKLVLSKGDVLGATADPATTVELFNLADDPRETKNLASSHPDEVARLREHLAAFGRMQMKGVAAYGEGRRGFKAPKDWLIKN
jgi:hypothetical protein